MDKVSFCITCKGRLYHIKETLPRNLAAERDDPAVEFVLLDYESEDGLADYIASTFQAEIASGRLVYAYHFPAPNFRMAHAKNMAHRLASGDILCNLDADNILSPGTARWLRQAFAKTPKATISARSFSVAEFITNRIVLRALRLPRPPAGLYGRIATRRETFDQLRGYDETFSSWGRDDADFQLRGRDVGVRTVKLPQALWGEVVTHDDTARVGNLSEGDRLVAAQRLAESFVTQTIDWAKRLHTARRTIANVDGQAGCGTVKINFSDTVTTLAPLPPVTAD